MSKKKMGKLPLPLLICCLLLGQLLVVSPAHAAGIAIFINGKQLQTPAAPYIQDGRVMVPFRALFEALGATVNWDEDRRAVTGAGGGIDISLTIDSNTAYVNDAPVTLDTPATITGGSTYVPLRFVAESLGAGVQWDSANYAVNITTVGASSSAGRPPVGAAASKTISITDSYGNVVLVPSPPKRIVCCNSEVAEAICAMGGADRIVGVDMYTNFPPVLQSKTNVGDSFTLNAEKIISLKPDIFFGYGLYADPAGVAQLKSHGIPVVMLDCYFPHSMASDITTLGQIMGQEQAAADFNAFYAKYWNLVINRVQNVPANQRPSVYLELYEDYNSVSGSSSSEELLKALGVRNIADSLGTAFPVVSPEWVVAQNPQVIIRVATSYNTPNGYGQSDSAMEMEQQEIMQRPAWDNISAVQSGKVIVISDEIFDSARTPIGVLYLAKYLYPSLFQDVDPAAIHQEWLSQFYGLSLNGTWVYPDIK